MTERTHNARTTETMRPNGQAGPSCHGEGLTNWEWCQAEERASMAPGKRPLRAVRQWYGGDCWVEYADGYAAAKEVGQ